MRMYFSRSLDEFLSAGDMLPDDAVELSSEAYTELMAAYPQGKTIAVDDEGALR